MTSRQRLLAALDRRVPDRLPATTHHLMPSFLSRWAGGMSERAFFDRLGLDAIHWTTPLRADATRGERADAVVAAGVLSAADQILSDRWQTVRETLPHPDYLTTRIRCVTPQGALSMVLQHDGRTTWVAERLVKEKRDIELIERFAPVPLCDVDAVNHEAASFGDRGIVRGAVPGFPHHGQPGCWQDAAALVGIERLILETFDDREWVNSLLGVLRQRKLAFLRSAAGARFDLLELGGGDASSTVISPKIFERFVAPFDASLVAAAHDAGLRIAYHTCGGMMPILDQAAGMGVDAMETFTPRSMSGDADLGEAKRRVGSRVCMIGGFDQFHFFVGCRPEDTRRAVRRCFEEAGEGGGFILAPSDHFFEAEEPLLDAFAAEARACVYQ